MPKASLFDNRAAAYEKLGDFNKALRDAQSTIRRHRKDVTVRIRLERDMQVVASIETLLIPQRVIFGLVEFYRNWRSPNKHLTFTNTAWGGFPLVAPTTTRSSLLSVRSSRVICPLQNLRIHF